MPPDIAPVAQDHLGHLGSHGKTVAMGHQETEAPHQDRQMRETEQSAREMSGGGA